MIRRFFARFAQTISDFLQHPFRVLVACLVLVFFGLVLDGTIFRLWRLQRDSTEISRRMTVLRAETLQLDQKIRRAKDPNFIELEAREKLDLASEGDLIFVFSDEQ